MSSGFRVPRPASSGSLPGRSSKCAAGGVKYPGRIVDGGAKVGPAVEVHQRYLVTCFYCRADDGDGQRALSTDDDRDLTGSENGGDLASSIAQYLKRPSQIVRAPLVRMRPPSHDRTVAVRSPCGRSPPGAR